MYIRNAIFFLFIALFLFIQACDETGMVSPALLQPPIDTPVDRALPEDVWETLKLVRQERLHTFLVISEPSEEVQAIIAEERKHIVTLEALQKAYYNRHIDAGGVPIIGNSVVADKHFVAARDVVLTVTSKHPELLNRFQTQFYMILAEDYSGLYNLPEFYQWDRHNPLLPSCEGSFGASASQVKGKCWAPALDFLPENNFKPYMTTFLHEFAHALDQSMHALDPTFQERRRHAYETAQALGTWVGTSVNRTPSTEYWAEAVEVWFYEIGEGKMFETREALGERDPLLYELLKQWFSEVSLPDRY